MAGIYIHIPFCKSRCRYCDFFSTTHLEKQSQYIEALLIEMQDRLQLHNNCQLSTDNRQLISTIYIGGGTPSTLQIEHLRAIFDCLANNIPHPIQGTDIEITLEANPGDITPEKAHAWRALGINRLSIGIQSFDDELLQLIGRRHTAAQARQAVATAQAAGFDNISIDLMYALPSQTMEMWQNDVAEALRLGVQHISTYGLIYEEGTVLMTLLDHGVVEAVDEDTEMQMYDYLAETLVANGFLHYEVSNFARPGHESKHNSSYWNDTPYIGLGAGAHSYNGLQRQWNISNLDSYIAQAITRQWQPETETLTQDQRHTEHIMLGLRTNRGVEISAVNRQRAEAYIAQGLLVKQDDRVVATQQGWHILNRIIEDLL